MMFIVIIDGEGKLGERKEESENCCYYRDGVSNIKPAQLLNRSSKSRISVKELKLR